MKINQKFKVNALVIFLSLLIPNAYSFENNNLFDNNTVLKESQIQDNLKNLANANNQKTKQDKEIVLPQGYSLKKIFNTKTFLYGNNETEVVVILHILENNPETNEPITINDLIAQEAKNASCEKPQKSTLGSKTLCNTNKHKWVSYYFQSPSNILIKSSSNNQSISPNIIKRLNNLSQAIYLYTLKIARNEKDIKYIEELILPFIPKEKESN
jgi:hypothetical protein